MAVIPNEDLGEPRDGQRSALADLPGVEIHDVADQIRAGEVLAGPVVRGHVKGRPVHFVVEAKSGGYPRDVRAAACELERVDLGAGSETVVSLVIAPASSENAREFLRRRGIGYWDESGRLYLDLPWAYYLVDRPVPKGARRRIRAVFRGTAASVAPP